MIDAQLQKGYTNEEQLPNTESRIEDRFVNGHSLGIVESPVLESWSLLTSDVQKGKAEAKI